jgi:drug/metabolite transporter (DMT)-like permease
MFIAGKSPVGYSPTIYVWMLALALIPQLLGHSTFNWALKYLPASVVSVTLLGEPIGSTVLAYIFLSESPTAFKLVGAVLILVGIYLSTLNDEKAGKEELEILPQGD